MSEPTREEMIDIFDTIIKNSPILSGRYEQIRIVCDAIRRLIETGPKVTKEFVEKWTSSFRNDVINGYAPKSWEIKEMLRELGHEIEEEKKT